MLILIRGAGDIATGIALRLHRAGMQVVMTDLPHPTAIRRTVCFSPAIALGTAEVEGVRAVCARDVPHARALLAACWRRSSVSRAYCNNRRVSWTSRTSS